MRKKLARDGSDWRFSTKVLLPVVTVTIAALALAGFVMFWAARQSNAISIDRQLRTTERSIQAVVGELAKQQEMVAVWDDAIGQLNKPTLDWQWLDANLGLWLNKTFGQDQVYILNARNEPIYAAVGDKRVSIAAYEQVRPGLENFIGDVRQIHDASDAEQNRQLAQTANLTTGKAVYDAHLLELLDRPAGVSAMKIVPESQDIEQEPGSEFLLVSVRFLDGSFLKQLSERNLIEGLRFSRSVTASPDEVSVPVKSDDGDLIGYFMWKPELPGTKILRVFGPSAAGVGILMVLVMGLLVLSLRRSMTAVQTTVVELRASEAQAHHLAFHDVLTGLPNRALFDDRLDQALTRVRRNEKLAVLMIDLDRFKHVNDTLGHQAGDSVVREFANRLSAVLRSTDTMARLGGDEFAIVQTGIESAHDVEVLCRRILDVVRQPFSVLGQEAFVGASIGIALAPEIGSERIDLMRKADIALYRAKAEGRDCYRFFTMSMDETVKLRGMVEDELRAALANSDELKIFYQPEVDSGGRNIIGLEALVRWQHPTRGLMSPDQFIPIAEETGLISQLGEWVLRSACSTSRRLPDLFIAINLSPIQFRTAGFAEKLIEIVRECGADPRSFELEVTESVLLEDSQIVSQSLQTLRREGFKIALDDFGTGYSSLSHLRRFDVDKIKIDRSFVQHLGQEDESAAIVTAIVALAHAMRLTVTAEGVETEDQKRFLSTLGCNEMQGFLFSRALPEDQISALMSKLRRGDDPALPAGHR